MKRLLYLISLASTLLFLASCSDSGDSDDIIWDISPVSVYMDIRDSQDNSLLNPMNEGNVVGQPLTVEYNGNVYDVMWETVYPKMTRYYYAEFMGVWHHMTGVSGGGYGVDNTSDSKWILEIGELPGDETYDVTLPVTFNGHTYELRVVNKFGWNKKNRPVIKTSVYLDGEECPDGLVVLHI